MRNSRKREHSGDIRCYSAPVPRQVLRDLTIQGERGIMEESRIDFAALSTNTTWVTAILLSSDRMADPNL